MFHALVTYVLLSRHKTSVFVSNIMLY